MLCPSCSAESPHGKRFCGSCGAVLSSGSEMPTEAVPHRPRGRGGSESRFLPGTVLAGRYRIVGLLGRGGMGEVYRADDNRLGQPVALKFLPDHLKKDPSRRDRLLEEVKLARQVAHPNVCRMYDVTEADGELFLSMEYVDGENLASLLRRIGRLPGDKASQLARQISVGLAAAHAEGILHRDLKPGNIMLDGRGRARIMDFGLAAFGGTEGASTASGTPAYMAPEQAEGNDVTVSSDIYSLGLVLYELYTGKRAFDAASSATTGSTPTHPSSHIGEIDPAVERVILRCLEHEPAARPASAMAVAAALPGGDPLAAALAAGETPAPEVVAAAGGEGALRPAVAATCLVAALAGLLLSVLVQDRYGLLHRSPVPYPPDVMVQKAREIVEDLGYREPAVDEAWAFYNDWTYVTYLMESEPTAVLWERLSRDRPTPMGFWYRTSPEPLRPNLRNVWYSNPAPMTAGMIGLRMDTLGRLRSLRVTPPDTDEGDPPATEIDWAPLFAAAGLDEAEFSAALPRNVPLLYCDTRAAWDGHYPDQPDTPVRIEACAYRGRIASLLTVHPWSGSTVQITSAGSFVSQVMFGTLFFGFLGAGALMARRNLRMGRGDRRGALRLASICVGSSMIAWVLMADHVPDAAEMILLFRALGFALVLGTAVWVFYMAMEPTVRRVWPELLISWTRLLDGRFRDPLVGRDILFGALLGVGSLLLIHSVFPLAEWLGLPPESPSDIEPEALHGARWLVGWIFDGVAAQFLLAPMLELFVLVFARLVLRRRWLAIGVHVGIGLLFGIALVHNWLVFLPLLVAGFALGTMAFVRHGLVGGMVSQFMFNLNTAVVLTLDPSAWYFGYSLASLILAAGIMIYGFWISLGGRSLLPDKP